MSEPEQPLMDLPDGVMTDGDQATKLKELTAQATSKYSVKDYNAAAELYAYATELQAEINGEMSSQNADLLYSYGRCLYHVAIKKSDVLGQNLPGETSDNGSKGSRKEQKRKRAEGMKGDPERTVAEEFVTQIVEEKEALVKPKEESENGNKPLFQFTGDENFDDSRDEEDEVEEEADEEEADDEDDFVMAYEVLDIARVLLQKKVTEVEDASGKGKGKGEPQEVRQLKERLADTYDLQAEISLEGEKFSIAVIDLKSALELKEALYEHEHSHIAEAHYKLSLALEFSSVTQQKDENGETQETRVDEEMREEAAQELEAAISSCKLRIQKEEAKLKSFSQVNGEDGKPKVTKEDIEEVKDMIKELQQRLVDIRQPPVSIKDESVMGAVGGSNAITGLLSSMLGESPAAQKARVEEASRGANDLTGLIKKKKPAVADTPNSAESETAQSSSNGKRKVDFDEEVEEVGSGKKAKTSDTEGN